MTKDVLVTVSGHLVGPESEETTVEVTTAGFYYLKNGKHYILFEEIGDNIREVVKNTIIIDRFHVDVRKKGAIESQMSFEEGCKLNSFYVTPYGQMELGVLTDSIELVENGSVLELKLKYHLDINNEHVSDNRLHILIQALEQ